MTPACRAGSISRTDSAHTAETSAGSSLLRSRNRRTRCSTADQDVRALAVDLVTGHGIGLLYVASILEGPASVSLISACAQLLQRARQDP